MTALHLDIRWTDPLAPETEVLISFNGQEYTFIAKEPCNGLDFQRLEMLDWPEGLSKTEQADCDSCSSDVLPDINGQNLND